ncbi:hypothetical protein CHUAL_002950 [Chamberlinius hualienensis]
MKHAAMASGVSAAAAAAYLQSQQNNIQMVQPIPTSAQLQTIPPVAATATTVSLEQPALFAAQLQNQQVDGTGTANTLTEESISSNVSSVTSVTTVAATAAPISSACTSQLVEKSESQSQLCSTALEGVAALADNQSDGGAGGVDSSGELCDSTCEGRERRLDRKKTGGKRRKTLERIPKLTVLRLDGSMVECQLETTKQKTVTFVFDSAVTVPTDIANNLVVSNLLPEQHSSLFVEQLADIVRQLKENPDRLPVVAFNVGDTCTSPNVARRHQHMLQRRSDSHEEPLKKAELDQLPTPDVEGSPVKRLPSQTATPLHVSRFVVSPVVEPHVQSLSMDNVAAQLSHPQMVPPSTLADLALLQHRLANLSMQTGEINAPAVSAHGVSVDTASMIRGQQQQFVQQSPVSAEPPSAFPQQMQDGRGIIANGPRIPQRRYSSVELSHSIDISAAVAHHSVNAPPAIPEGPSSPTSPRKQISGPGLGSDGAPSIKPVAPVTTEENKQRKPPTAINLENLDQELRKLHSQGNVNVTRKEAPPPIVSHPTLPSVPTVTNVAAPNVVPPGQPVLQYHPGQPIQPPQQQPPVQQQLPVTTTNVVNAATVETEVLAVNSVPTNASHVPAVQEQQQQQPPTQPPAAVSKVSRFKVSPVTDDPLQEAPNEDKDSSVVANGVDIDSIQAAHVQQSQPLVAPTVAVRKATRSFSVPSPHGGNHIPSARVNPLIHAAFPSSRSSPPPPPPPSTSVSSEQLSTSNPSSNVASDLKGLLLASANKTLTSSQLTPTHQQSTPNLTPEITPASLEYALAQIMKGAFSNLAAVMNSAIATVDSNGGGIKQLAEQTSSKSSPVRKSSLERDESERRSPVEWRDVGVQVSIPTKNVAVNTPRPAPKSIPRTMQASSVLSSQRLAPQLTSPVNCMLPNFPVYKTKSEINLNQTMMEQRLAPPQQPQRPTSLVRGHSLQVPYTLTIDPQQQNLNRYPSMADLTNVGLDSDAGFGSRASLSRAKSYADVSQLGRSVPSSPLESPSGVDSNNNSRRGSFRGGLTIGEHQQQLSRARSMWDVAHARTYSAGDVPLTGIGRQQFKVDRRSVPFGQFLSSLVQDSRRSSDGGDHNRSGSEEEEYFSDECFRHILTRQQKEKEELETRHKSVNPPLNSWSIAPLPQSTTQANGFQMSPPAPTPSLHSNRIASPPTNNGYTSPNRPVMARSYSEGLSSLKIEKPKTLTDDLLRMFHDLSLAKDKTQLVSQVTRGTELSDEAKLTLNQMKNLRKGGGTSPPPNVAPPSSQTRVSPSVGRKVKGAPRHSPPPPSTDLHHRMTISQSPPLQPQWLHLLPAHVYPKQGAKVEMPIWAASWIKKHQQINKNDVESHRNGRTVKPNPAMDENRNGISTVELFKNDRTTLGLIITGGSDKDCRAKIANLRPGSIAYRSDLLCVGDTILSVNGIRTAKLKHEEIANLLKNAGDRVVLEVEYDLPCSAAETLANVSSKVIQVRLEKENGSFGFVLRGGVNVGCPLTVTHVRPGGPADREGTIKPGDRLVAIDNRNLPNVSCSEVSAIFNRIEREAVFTIEYDVSVMESVRYASGPLLIEIERGFSPANQQLGVALAASPHTSSAILIQSIKQASLAERCGALHVGDQLLAIDGVTLDSNATAAEASQLLRNSCGEKICLEILPLSQMLFNKRIPERKGTTSPSLSSFATLSGAASRRTNNSRRLIMQPSHSNASIPSCGSSCSSLTNPVACVQVCRSETTEVTLISDYRGFGFALRPSSSSTYPVIGSFDPGGPAESSGVIQVGDRVIAVDGMATDGLSIDQVTHMISASKPKVTLSMEFDVAESVVPSSGVFDIKLARNNGISLGISITAANESVEGDPPVISEVKRGSVAHRTGTVRVGDQLLAIGDHSVDGRNIDEAIERLQECRDDVVRLRIRKGAKDGATDINEEEQELLREGWVIYSVELKRVGSGPLGITLSGSDEPNRPIIISALAEGGIAEKTGALHHGDRLLAIDGRPVHGKALGPVIHQLQNSVDSVFLKVSCRRNKHCGVSSASDDVEKVSKCGSGGIPQLSIDSAVESWDGEDSATNSIVVRQQRASPTMSKELEDFEEKEENDDGDAVPECPTSKSEEWRRISCNSSRESHLSEEDDEADRDWVKILSEFGAKDTTCTQVLQRRMSEENLAIRGWANNAAVPVSGGYVNCSTLPHGCKRHGRGTTRGVPVDDCNSSAPYPIELHRVTLFKDSVYEDFGFSLSDGLYERGVYVNRIRPGGPADMGGILKPFDRILQVNDTKTHDFDCCLTVPLIAAAGDRINLVVVRNPSTSGRGMPHIGMASLPWMEEEDKECSSQLASVSTNCPSTPSATVNDDPKLNSALNKKVVTPIRQCLPTDITRRLTVQSIDLFSL